MKDQNHEKTQEPHHAETCRQLERKVVSISVVLDLLGADDDTGACIDCGHQQGCVEPDARQYACEECGKRWVYGAEELMIMMQPTDGPRLLRMIGSDRYK